MRIEELNERIGIMTLGLSDKVYSWVKTATIWSKVERINGNNLFSSVGLGAKTVKFIVRKCDITLYDAFNWENKHCFLTDIVEIDRMYFEITAAIIEPKICIVERISESRNELNRPIINEDSSVTFPGCLTEKYLGSNQEKPMTTVETRYILVTPKIIILEIGELVKIDERTYEVMLSHLLDDYKNEYEIRIRSDA